MQFKKVLSVLLAFSFVFCSFARAEEQKSGNAGGIKLYIDGEETVLKHPIIKEGDIVYFPMKDLFFKFGIYMAWNEEEKGYAGTGKNGEIIAKKDMTTVEIDWVDVELPAPTKEIDGILYLPSYIIEDAIRTNPAVYNESENALYIDSPDYNYEGYKDFDLESLERKLPQGDELLTEEEFFQASPADGAKYMKMEEVEVEGMPFKRAWRIETLPYPDGTLPEAIYHIQGAKIINKDFLAGETGIMTFWARAIKIVDESGSAGFKPTYEQLDTWQKAQDASVFIDHFEWKKYYLPLYSGQYDLLAGKSRLCLAVGCKGGQIIEIADMHIRNFHFEVDPVAIKPTASTTYKGMEDDALWRKEAYRRIEKYRKNDMVITVKDENGNPVKGAKVNADMTKNEFMYGLAIMEKEICGIYPEDSKIDKIKDTVVRETCNLGVEAFWMKRSPTNYGEARETVNEFWKRGLDQRGHALSWNHMGLTADKDAFGDAPGMRNYPDREYDDIYDHLMRFATEKVWMFKGMFRQWDGLNEPYDSNSFRRKYTTQAYSDIFKMTKALDPTSKVFVNETGMEGHPDKNHAKTMRAKGLSQIVENMIDNERAPIDGIGIQAHCTQYYYPQGFYYEMDYLSKLVDEMAITEYDFYPADFTNAPLHLRDTFLAVFSHPKATAFVIWGYQDTMHWRGYGPFYSRTWQKKPEYDEWLRIVNDEFKSRLEGETDENGQVVLRGLRGDYDITVSKDGKEGKTAFTLSNSADAKRDNWINAEINGGKIEISAANSPEQYAKQPVKFRSSEEAYADYLEKTGGINPIGIYKHTDKSGNSIKQTNDGLENTFWYAEEKGDFINYELVEKASEGELEINFRNVNGESYDFKVQTSADGENWETVFEGNSGSSEKIEFKNALFIKIVSESNDYMGISEVKINAKK